MTTLRYIAIAGNILFILWMFYNGIDEGSQGIGVVQLVAISGLQVLLCLNVFLLWRDRGIDA